jgi:hypothetical protein
MLVHVAELDHGLMMEAMGRLRAFFGGHPDRIGGAAAAVVIAAAGAWYLGSPLFIRTYTNEALPIASPAPSTPDTASPTAAGTATPTPALERTRVLASGELNFVDAIHNGKGPVRIIEVTPGASRFVRFEDVAITNAPDVHVYLSRESGGKWSEATSLYLGPLKATNGSFNYELGQADLTAYRSVVVWCRAFSVLITWADLS